MYTVLLLILAIVPGVVTAIYIYLEDKHEPEPAGMLIVSFAYGILGFFLAIGITFLLNSIIVIQEGELKGEAVHAFVFVALVEEVCKFAFIRGILYRNKNFNEPFDGIVYAVVVAMGFATAENIFYVLGGGAGVGIIRMILAIPAHAVFAIMMGYFLGKAKFAPKKQAYYAVIALLSATVLHGFYDYFLFLSFIPGLWIMAIVSLVVAFFLSREAIRLHQDASPFRMESGQNGETGESIDEDG